MLLLGTLIVFVKYPEPGKVKTRLAVGVGSERAAELYKGFVERILEQVNSSTYKIVLYCDQAERLIDFKNWLGADYDFKFQEGEDLGERMKNAFYNEFEDGANHVSIIGTDCLSIDECVICNAFDNLQDKKVVLGPASDGGYYLLALREFRDDIFKNVNWSTEKVFEQTVSKIEEGCGVLPVLSDIDTYQDYQTYLKEGVT